MINFILEFIYRILGKKKEYLEYRELVGKIYKIRVYTDTDFLKSLITRFGGWSVKMNYHKGIELYIWGEAVFVEDINESLLKPDVENGKKIPRGFEDPTLKRIWFGGWKLQRKYGVQIPDASPARSYTHAITIYRGGRFYASSNICLGKHYETIPLDLGVYGDRSVIYVISEAIKNILNKPLTDVNWNTVIKRLHRYK